MSDFSVPQSLLCTKRPALSLPVFAERELVVGRIQMVPLRSEGGQGPSHVSSSGKVCAGPSTHLGPFLLQGEGSSQVAQSHHPLSPSVRGTVPAVRYVGLCLRTLGGVCSGVSLESGLVEAVSGGL